MEMGYLSVQLSKINHSWADFRLCRFFTRWPFQLSTVFSFANVAPPVALIYLIFNGLLPSQSWGWRYP